MGEGGIRMADFLKFMGAVFCAFLIVAIVDFFAREAFYCGDYEIVIINAIIAAIAFATLFMVI